MGLLQLRVGNVDPGAEGGHLGAVGLVGEADLHEVLLQVGEPALGGLELGVPLGELHLERLDLE